MLRAAKLALQAKTAQWMRDRSRHWRARHAQRRSPRWVLSSKGRRYPRRRVMRGNVSLKAKMKAKKAKMQEPCREGAKPERAPEVLMRGRPHSQE